MIDIIYAPSFVKQLNKIELSFQDEILEKIDFLKDEDNHKFLKVHKLHGKFKYCFSFSVDYRTRIVFQYITKNKVALLSIGDHDIYK